MIPLHQWLERVLVPVAGQGLAASDDAQAEIMLPASVRPELELAEARQAGRAEAEAEAKVALQLQAEAAEAALAQALAAERQRWSTEQAAAVTTQLAAAVATLHQDIGDAVGDLLKPLLRTLIRDRAISELQALLARHLKTAGVAEFRVSGPADLLEPMRAALADSPVAVRFTASEDCDVEVVADMTVFRSDIASWCAAIEGSHG